MTVYSIPLQQIQTSMILGHYSPRYLQLYALSRYTVIRHSGAAKCYARDLGPLFTQSGLGQNLGR